MGMAWKEFGPVFDFEFEFKVEFEFEFEFMADFADDSEALFCANFWAGVAASS
jgi:hypothetical protein